MASNVRVLVLFLFFAAVATQVPGGLDDVGLSAQTASGIVPDLPVTSQPPPNKRRQWATCLQNKVKWLSLGLQYYSYDIKRSCFCFPLEFTAQVSVTVCGFQATEPPYYEDVNTMVKVFDVLCQAILEADEVTVSYHPTYYFPTSIGIDYIEMAIDDEKGYTISNFQTLTPQTCSI
eukprot:TRINITY_DN1747_c0_g1_i1.p2 TRINITY_DN1747_c0_g1~~TRINITY_DN1747_c0_g1_i1.p2  ORF type:complete len:176 (-),score=8.28 TRINITY_DN1747_c0_g1_i1:512-1039(-)